VTHRALVIGIDRYANLPYPLEGCVNDAKVLGALLEQRFAFPPDQIVTLLDEHVQGRAIVSRIVAGTSSASAGSPTAAADLARAMREFGTLLHAHIRREENDCFAVADRELPAQVQEQLLEGYERIEREVIGAGRHEAFHAMLERLADTYVR